MYIFKLGACPRSPIAGHGFAMLDPPRLTSGHGPEPRSLLTLVSFFFFLWVCPGYVPLGHTAHKVHNGNAALTLLMRQSPRALPWSDP